MQSVTATPHPKPITTTQYIVAVLWPSFLIAGLANTLFFILFDPLELARGLGIEGVTRIGAYSVGFFSFWLMTCLSSALTQYFQRPCALANKAEPKA
jgi:hypothetical protein